MYIVPLKILFYSTATLFLLDITKKLPRKQEINNSDGLKSLSNKISFRDLI